MNKKIQNIKEEHQGDGRKKAIFVNFSCEN